MKDIKKEIIDAGIYLLDTGLIARTWGNISARIDDETFLITPSGKDYTLIKPEDLAVVRTDDCSYDKSGPKPSSEKRIHAACYNLRKDCKYVIHTHQLYASALCAAGKDITLPDETLVPCAPYGLPGTKTLANNVIETIKNHLDADMFLMERHGAFIIGESMQDAIAKANHLELQCRFLFEAKVKEIVVPNKMKAYLDDYAQMVPYKTVDDPEALKMVSEKNAAAMLYCKDLAKPMNIFDRTLQNIVYKMKYSKLRDK